MYLTQALHRAVQQHPDRVAVRFGTRQRTFREFADRVARLAGALQKLGMQPGDRVAMLALNSDRYLEYQMIVDLVALAQAIDDATGQPRGIVGGMNVLLEHDEFVAAEAGHEILGPQHLAQPGQFPR